MSAPVILIVTSIAAAFIVGVIGGAASADWLRGLRWAPAGRIRERRGQVNVYVPAAEPALAPDHPRFGPLTATPPGGITVVREDGAISIRADLPARRKHTEDHAPTGPFAAVPYAPEPPTWAGPPPTIEELRKDYFRWQQESGAAPDPVTAWPVPAHASLFSCCKHCDTSPCETPGRHHVACIDCHPVPGFGVDRCEADVLAAAGGAE